MTMVAILASSPTGARFSAIHGQISRLTTLVRIPPISVKLRDSSAGAILGGSAASFLHLQHEAPDTPRTGRF